MALLDEDERFALSADEYLARYDIPLYLNDAIASMLVRKRDKSKPLHFLAGYFASVVRGEHVVFREFAFVNATARNRRAFLDTVRRVYGHLAVPSSATASPTSLNGPTFHALVALLCRDFPWQLVQATVSTVLVEESSDCVMTLPDLMHAFQLHLCYPEFIQALSAAVTAAIGKSGGSQLSQAQLEAILKQLSPKQPRPSQAALDKAVAGGTEYDSFEAVVARLAACPAINDEIGVLPCPGDDWQDMLDEEASLQEDTTPEPREPVVKEKKSRKKSTKT